MATYKTVMRLALEYASSIWSPLASSTCKSCKTQIYNICMTKHSHFPYTSNYSFTPHNTNKKTQHPSHPLHKHITRFNTPRLKTNIFNNGRYTTNIPTDPHTVTTTDIKTNMYHIHPSIASRHLPTRGNNKMLRTPPPHIISSEEILPCLTGAPLPNSEQMNNPFLNHNYTKSTPNHIHHHYAPFVTLTHTSSLQLHPYTHHFVTPGFVDRPRRSDGTAGQMDVEACWWTTSGKIGLPH